jgi:hypothetical protein
MTDGLSASDVALLQGNGRSSMGGFGDGEGWWVIILFALIFGWGRGGWGGCDGGNGGGTYLGENYALITDNATLERKIDGVYAGICDSTYALNNTMTNGFASAQNTMTQGFAGLNTALVTQGYEGRIATQGVGSQLAQCCCDLRQQISDVNYNIATQANGINSAMQSGFCQTNFNNATNTRDIIDSQNANTRAILDAINANKVEALKERISEQNQQINSLQLTASQTAQNAYLVDKLGYHCPVSAYVVQPPQTVSFPTGCNGYANYTQNSGCGCGNIQ